MDFERETEELLKRLEKSNKIFVANAATEGWKIKKTFPVIKEKYPDAKIYTIAKLIYLTVKKEQKENLIIHLKRRKETYEEMVKNEQYVWGENEEIAKETLEEIGKVLQELEEE